MKYRDDSQLETKIHQSYTITNKNHFQLTNRRLQTIHQPHEIPIQLHHETVNQVRGKDNKKIESLTSGEHQPGSSHVVLFTSRANMCKDSQSSQRSQSSHGDRAKIANRAKMLMTNRF